MIYRLESLMVQTSRNRNLLVSRIGLLRYAPRYAQRNPLQMRFSSLVQTCAYLFDTPHADARTCMYAHEHYPPFEVCTGLLGLITNDSIDKCECIPQITRSALDR